jgi:hypothetical protein
MGQKNCLLPKTKNIPLTTRVAARSLGSWFRRSSDARKNMATDLYSGETVADYIPESVAVTVSRGVTEPATCYDLHPNKLSGNNSAYAESLLVAAKLGFPEKYQKKIRMEGGLG